MKKVSLADIAERAGVSKTLVSMVLNGRGKENGIRPETQQLVLDIAQELNYKPNRIARHLRTGKSHTIGMLVSDISNPFFAALCRSVEDHVSQLGYNLMICSSDESPEKEAELIDILVNRQVDGLIISTSQEDPQKLQALLKNGPPVVLIDRVFRDMPFDQVGVGNVEAARKATEALLASGAERIGHITISPAYLSTIQDRTKGFIAALQEASIQDPEAWVGMAPYKAIQEGVEEVLHAWFSRAEKPDGLFFANNRLAVYGLRVLRDLGISIPEDVKIISFDDTEVFQLLDTPISALQQPLQEMGQTAAKLIIEAIARPASSPKSNLVELPVELVFRASCPQPQQASNTELPLS